MVWFSRRLKSVLSMQAHRPSLAYGFAQVSRSAPPLPGGYKVGEKVFFTGASLTFDDGESSCTASRAR